MKNAIEFDLFTHGENRWRYLRYSCGTNNTQCINSPPNVLGSYQVSKTQVET